MYRVDQLIVVTTKRWDSKKGRCYLFSKKKGFFVYDDSFPVVLGKNGMRWGEGLHKIKDERIKQEGDGASPAGVFFIGPAFGNEDMVLDNGWVYLKTSEDDYFIDDSKSRYYNTWVNRNVVRPDWKSHEVMLRPDGLYNKGLVIKHNMAPVKPKHGSAIFFHIWKNRRHGTAGCTAMSEKNMTKLIHWLKKDNVVALVQLPKPFVKSLL